jgi:hypothetical protein
LCATVGGYTFKVISKKVVVRTRFLCNENGPGTDGGLPPHSFTADG